MTDIATFLAGAVGMAYAVAAVFFLRFWTRAKDGLFLSFAAAFALFAINQSLIGIFGVQSEMRAAFYSLRLIGFGLIIFAIIRKNLAKP
jgi:heme A synthase